MTMRHLTTKHYRVMLENLRLLYAETSLEALRRRMVIDLRRLVPGDYIAFNLIQRAPEARVIARFAEPDPPLATLLQPAFNAHCREHPFFGVQDDWRAPQARKFSDFLSQRQLMATGLFNEYYRKLGTRFQMYFPFDAGGPFGLGISINRRAKDFNETDRAILNLLIPHYRQAHANVSLLEQERHLRSLLADAQSVSGEGTLVANRGGRVDWVSRQARNLLCAYLDFEVEVGRRLPELLRRWCEAEPLAVESPSRPLRLTAARGTLILRIAAHREDQVVLFFREQPLAESSLPVPRLTSRENEVLSWLAQAKSNAEIAVILGLSVRTVGKHLENIFAKLGVENRAAAMRLFLDHGRGDPR